jgi:diaminopimelate epimerase
MAGLRFQKYEGLGNDFLVVDGTAVTEAEARLLCDRHFGVGGDGVLIVGPPRTPGARASMQVINADGSRPEMCGNGLRCVALHLAIGDGLDETRYVLDTDAGTREALVVRSGERGVVTLDMGNGELGEDHRESHAGQSYKFLRVSMGNPHAIVFDASFDERAMDEIGPRVSAASPQGSNVESVVARGPRAFDVIVWERGVGRTLACGTGAAAVAVALATSGRAPYGEPLEVRLPGGPLELVVSEGSLRVSLKGPARRVFSGEVSS